MADEPKKRHGCLTAFLIVAILLNALTAFGNLAAGEAIEQTLPDAPSWGLPVLALLGVVNIVSLIAIWLWKKWGFFGVMLSGFITVFVNLAIGVNVMAAVMGLIGVAVLYGVLQIGDDKTKGWTQLD